MIFLLLLLVFNLGIVDIFYAFLGKALEGIASKYSIILCGDTNMISLLRKSRLNLLLTLDYLNYIPETNLCV